MRVVWTVLLVTLSLLLLVPTGMMILGSFQIGGGMMRIPPVVDIKSLTLYNYKMMFRQAVLVGRWSLNTAGVVVAAVTVASITSVAAAFALVQKPLGHRALFGLLMVAAIVPGMVTVIPRFLTMRTLGLGTGLVAATLPGCVLPIGILYARSHLISLGQDYFDEARIAGAGEWRIFWTVALPMSRSIIALVLLFGGLGMMQDYLWQTLVLSDPMQQTLLVGLMSEMLRGQGMGTAQSYGSDMVVPTLLLLPMIAVFVVGHRWFTGEGVKL